jgi:RNA polymerase nonessential primary-like sigma factor
MTLEPKRQARSTKQKQTDSFTAYLCEIGRYALLDREQEKYYGGQVFEMMQYEEERRKLGVPLESYIILKELDPAEINALYEAGNKARKILIEHNLRLVVSVAKRYNNLNLSIYDLVQEGNAGLVKGVEKYNPHYGVKLSTYVSYWIKEAINKGISRTGRLVRLPVHVTDKLRLIRKINKGFLTERGRPATMREVCEITGFTPDYIITITNYLKRPASLNMSVETTAGSMMEFIEYVIDPSDNGEEEIVHSNIKVILDDLLSCLPERDKNIVMDLNGLTDTGKRMSCSDVAEKYNLCAGRVKQIEREAIKRLREEFTAVPEVTERIISCLE